MQTDNCTLHALWDTIRLCYFLHATCNKITINSVNVSSMTILQVANKLRKFLNLENKNRRKRNIKPIKMVIKICSFHSLNELLVNASICVNCSSNVLCFIQLWAVCTLITLASKICMEICNQARDWEKTTNEHVLKEWDFTQF